MNKSDGTSMRRASSIVYAVFVVCALLLVNVYSKYAGVTSIPIGILIEYIAIFIFAAISVKLFGGKGEVSSSSCRKLAFITLFYVIFNVFTFSIQKECIALSWQVIIEGAPGATTPDYGLLPIVFLIVKLILPVIALFLASMSVSEQYGNNASYVVTDTVVQTSNGIEETVEIDEEDKKIETKEQEEEKKELEREKKKKVRY